MEIVLTSREKEILNLSFVGKQRKEIAVALGLEDSTIKWHLHNMRGKFKASNATEMIYKALVCGVLKVPQTS